MFETLVPEVAQFAHHFVDLAVTCPQPVIPPIDPPITPPTPPLYPPFDTDGVTMARLPWFWRPPRVLA
jgi:hypothetical protein